MDLKASHRFLMERLHALDKTNNAIIAVIARLSSGTKIKKDHVFLMMIRMKKRELAEGRKNRENVRLQVRLIKEQIKERNRREKSKNGC